MREAWSSDVLTISDGRYSRVCTSCVVFWDMVKDQRPPAAVIQICMGCLGIERDDKQMRRVRILCEDGGGTVSPMKRTANVIIWCNGSHITAHPTEKMALSSIVPRYDVRWGPVIVFSMSNRVCRVVGFKWVDPNIEAQICF